MPYFAPFDTRRHLAERADILPKLSNQINFSCALPDMTARAIYIVARTRNFFIFLQYTLSVSRFRYTVYHIIYLQARVNAKFLNQIAMQKEK